MKLMKYIGIILTLSVLATSLYAADSAGNRKDNIILIGASSGIHGPSLLAPPITIAIPGENWTVGVDYGSSTYSTTSGTASSSATYSNQGLYARYFTGNSFNFLMAVHQRDYVAEATATSGSAFATLDLTAKSTIGTLGIGNQWTMDWGLVIGIDWLLGSGALSQSSEATIKTNTGVDTTTATSDAVKIGDLANAISGSAGLFVMTFGFSF